jgi:hypothetical protein
MFLISIIWVRGDIVLGDTGGDLIVLDWGYLKVLVEVEFS